jgi:hypothetical protein
MAQDLAAAGALVAHVYGEAVAIASELEQIAAIYGPDCVAEVKRALLESADADWQRVISATVTNWSARRAVPDPAFA